MLRLPHHISWALADQIIVSGSNFLTNLLLARILGIEEFGRYVLAWTIVLSVQNLQYSATSTAMMSIGPKRDPVSSPYYFGALFMGQAVFGIGSTLLVFVGAKFAAMTISFSQLDTIAAPIAITVLCSQTQDFLRRYFFSVDRSRMSFACDLVRYLGQNVALLALYTTANSAPHSDTALWLAALSAAVASLVVIPWIPQLRLSTNTGVTIVLHAWLFSKWLTTSCVMT